MRTDLGDVVVALDAADADSLRAARELHLVCEATGTWPSGPGARYLAVLSQGGDVLALGAAAPTAEDQGIELTLAAVPGAGCRRYLLLLLGELAGGDHQPVNTQFAWDSGLLAGLFEEAGLRIQSQVSLGGLSQVSLVPISGALRASDRPAGLT